MPSHKRKLPFFIARMKVLKTGYPDAACKYCTGSVLDLSFLIIVFAWCRLLWLNAAYEVEGMCKSQSPSFRFLGPDNILFLVGDSLYNSVLLLMCQIFCRCWFCESYNNAMQLSSVNWPSKISEAFWRLGRTWAVAPFVESLFSGRLINPVWFAWIILLFGSLTFGPVVVLSILLSASTSWGLQ